MVRVLAILASTSDAMAWYRSTLPFIRLMQEADDLHVDFISVNTKVNWDLLSQYDLAFTQRPQGDKHVEMLSLCKGMDVPIWVDFDDPLWAVSPDSPAYAYYASASVQDSIEQCVRLADVITVSTGALGQSVKERYGVDAFTIHNGVDFYKLQKPAGRLKDDADTVIWRGSDTHRMDLMSAKDRVMSAEKALSLKWIFMGMHPWFVMDDLKEATHIDYIQDTYLFFKTLHKVEGNVLFVPLQDNLFNRCKSNIAALEAVVSGIIPVVPEWWSDFRFEGNESIESVMALTRSEREDMWVDMVEVVRNKYNLHTLNKHRLDIIQHLL